MFKKASMFFILLLLISVTLPGCLDSREIDDEVYAITLGIDKGIKNKVRITVQYSNYKNGGGVSGNNGDKGGANSQNGSNIDTIDAPSILEGINMFGMSISRRVSLMHTKLFVVSEELAKEGIGAYTAPIARFRETRGSMWMVVSKNKAEEFINANQVTVGNNISKSTELTFEEGKYSNYFPLVQFKDFYKALLSTYRQPYTIYGAINSFKSFSSSESIENSPLLESKGFLPGDTSRKGSSKIEYAGMAVFVGDKMVASLDTSETTYFLMITGKFPSGKVTFEDENAPGLVIVADMRSSRKPNVKTYFKNGVPIIDVKVQMEADIESIQSRIHYEHYSKVGELNKMMETSLLESSKKLIKKLQKELKSDVFGFGRWVVNNFSTIQKWESYDWISQFPKAKINIEYVVNIRRFGSMLMSKETKHSKSYNAEKEEENK